MNWFHRFFLLIIASVFHFSLQAQTSTVDQLGRSNRPITTAVPFLTIAPDARSGAMGDVGVAISPDANSMHWNAAKLAFIESDIGFSLSYNPWLRKLINDMSLSYLTGYKRISKQETIGFSLLYFNLGSIQFTDNTGAIISDFKPKEFCLSATYSRKLSDKLSIAPTLKYINSNLSGNVLINSAGTTSRPGQSAAVDLGIFYKTKVQFKNAMSPSQLAFGANISNFGGKISYTNTGNRDFIPTNLRIGSALTHELDQYNKFTFALDLNKLMVPSTPIYSYDSTGALVVDANGKPVVAQGSSPSDKSLFSGVFGSFADAPDGLKEELKEFMISAGVEYWYNNLFAVRAGFFNEAKTKGNRKYFNLGLGIRYNKFGLDFAYLVPLKQNNPLAETLRFTLHFDFAKKDSTPLPDVGDQE